MSENPDNIVPPVEPVAPVIEPKIEPAVAPEPSAISPSPYVEKYANKLKTELGESYSTKFDKMGVEARIDAMEATLDVLGKKAPVTAPLVKGEIPVPLGEQPPQDNKPKSFLELQKSEGYGEKLKHSNSYAALAKKLYGK